MPLKNGPSTRRRIIPAALTALALPLGGGAAVGTAPAGAMSMASMGSTTMHASAPGGHAPAGHGGATGAGGSMFRVGSPTHPLMEGGPAGPLWSASPASIPGRAAHGTFGAIYVAGQLARAAAEREHALGIVNPDRFQATAASAATTTGALTPAQAAKRLSRFCQKLIRTKPSKLSKANRKRRTACLARRDALVAASHGTTTTPATTPVATPMPAPSAPILGPAPAATPTATPAPTPAATPTAPAATGIDPNTVVCSAVGVTAIDIQPFGLTRGIACTSDAGNVTFQFTNRDSQTHGIAIKAAGAGDGTAVPIIPELAKQSGPVNKTVALKPGSYTLICTVQSHNPAMEVDLKILTKADYIAQGYAG